MRSQHALSRARSNDRSTIRGRGLRAALAALTSTAVVAAGVFAGAVPAANAVTGQISGVVYADYAGDGVYSTGNAAGSGIPNDAALAGITVTAYDRFGAQVGTATTAASVTASPRRNFTLTLAAGVTTGDPLRLEYTGLPTGAYDSFAGADNGTSVQFVAAGAEGVDYGVLPADEYNAGDPAIATAIQSAGSPSNGTASSRAAVVANAWSVPQNVSGGTASFANRITFATYGEVGSVWGLAYDKAGNDLFIGATYKRMSGLGSLGLGGIYVANDVLNASGVAQAPSSKGPWLDVTTLGINVGQGQIQSNADRGLGAPSNALRDANAFANAGRVGIGGMTVDPAAGILYFVNLFDSKVYGIRIADKTLVGSWATPATGQTGTQAYAILLKAGALYVGSNDTGTTAFQSAATAGLTYTVAKASVGAAGVSGAFSTVLTGGLGYQKGNPIYDWANQGTSVATANPQVLRWNTWTDQWTSGSNSVGFNTGWGQTQVYPQPLLSSLALDSSGFLTLGFQDRTAIQGGNRNLAADTAPNNQYFETVSGGDMLLAAPNADGTFSIENDGTATGTAGTRTAQSGRDEQPSTGEGPGGGEFYYDRQNNGTGSNHREASLGAVVTAPGVAQTVSTLMDPLSPVRVTGLSWFTASAASASGNGNNVKGFQHTQDTSSTQTSTDFQKGGGLGGVSLLAKKAPVEIGNRAWFDADQDGIQGADEPNIQGLTVQLWAADDSGNPTGANPLATKTTDAAGEYYFRSDTDGFAPGGKFVVVFVKPTTGTATLTGPNASTFGTISWADVSFTAQGAGSKTTIDSNANPANGRAPVTIGGPGQNDHTIDAGFIANTKFTVQKIIDAGGGQTAAGQTFTISLQGRDFRGTAITLPVSNLTLTGGQTSTAISVPVGAQVKVGEASDGSVKTVVVTPSDWTPIKDSGKTFAFKVTNTLYKPGTFTVTKAVTGAFANELTTTGALKDVVITVSYTSTAGTGSLTLDASNGWKATSPALPYGAVVTLSETSVTGAPPSVQWGEPSWSKNPVTIGDGTDTKVTLTNPTSELRGTFSVTKTVTGDAMDRVPGDFAFTVQYSLDGTTWTSLPAITKDAPTATAPGDFPIGTKIFLQELTPDPIEGVSWDDFVWGENVTPATETEPAYVMLAAGDQGRPFGVNLTNVTEQRNGQFSLEKILNGPSGVLGEKLSYTVQYTYPGLNEPKTVQITAGDPAWSSAPLPEGTKVTITEVGLSDEDLPANAAWGTPTLVIDGEKAANGATITIGSGTVVGVQVVNTITTTPTVTITKGDGDAEERTIAHEADTVADAEQYAPGETREIVIIAENTGPEPLVNVSLADATLAGAQVSQIEWTFPDGTSTFAVKNGQTWTADWASTFGEKPTAWAVGAKIYGTATLTLTGEDALPHQDEVSVSGTGQWSGKKVSDDNPYNAFVPGIQVIKYDGQKADPTVRENGAWVIPAKPLADAAQDANTTETAVKYPVDTAQKVRWVVTNTGDTWLTDLTLSDETQDGPAIGADWTADLSAFDGPAAYSFAKDGPWKGLLPPKASFFAEGTLTLPASETHADLVTVVGTVVVPAVDDNGAPTDEPAMDGDTPVIKIDGQGKPVTLTDDDPFHAYTGVGPIVEITKGDGDAKTGTIVHEADTVTDGQPYTPGETRDIVIRAQNTGDEPLVNVVLNDVTTSGAQIQSLEWTLPDGEKSSAVPGATAGTWTFSWDGPWLPGEWIIGTATLTVALGDQPHQDVVRVDAKGQLSGKPVGDDNGYNAFTGDIQVIKYDGTKVDPTVKSGDTWVVPGKPLADLDQDANDVDHAVEYPVDTPRPVRWVVTNTGTTWLTDITLTDTTQDGPAIGEDWTADLSAFGGPSDYSFAKDGPWRGLLPPKASFFAQGTLTLAAEQTHADLVDVVGTVVVPATDRETGLPTDQPLVDGETPVIATVPNPDNPQERVPFTVEDDDPFHAWTGVGPYVDIEKGDGEGTEIVHDADTVEDSQFYQPGETRTIVYRVTNTGDEPLRDVVLRDGTDSGAIIQDLVFTLPDGTQLTADQNPEGQWTARWEDTFGEGEARWLPGEVITGTATLTVVAADRPHLNAATVDAKGAASGKPVGDRDTYYALSGAIQVIKYDGNKPDPAVKDAEGAWIIPTKPLADAGQDANDQLHAVRYQAGATNTVRWVVTNTGTTWLTQITLADVTGAGPAIGDDWTADLSAFGGPSDYSFVKNGPWTGLLPPNASFFATGKLTLPDGSRHNDTVTVTGTPVVPATDEGGVPTDEPMIDEAGTPVPVLGADGLPVVLTDDDPFFAYTPLPITGGTVSLFALALGLGAIACGAGALWLRGRRKATEA